MFRALPRYDARRAPRGVGLLLTSGPGVPLVLVLLILVPVVIVVVVDAVFARLSSSFGGARRIP